MTTKEKNMTARKADDDWVLWNEKSAHGDPERSQSFVVSSQMKHFLFLIKTRKDRLASLSPEQMQQHVVNVRQFIESAISGGQIKVARAVEMTGFALSGFKGAFQEVRLDPNAEVVSAYYLVGAESLSDALLLAKADPRFQDAIWKTEIQPILDIEGISEVECALEESQMGLEATNQNQSK